MPGPTSTRIEIESAAADTAILPVGAWEQHGAHLPMETDTLVADEMARCVAERTGAVHLRALPYSTSLEHIDFAGTVTLSPSTLGDVVRDVARSCGRWGIDWLVLLNGHGGNFILNPVARQWNMERQSPWILLVDFYDGWTDRGENLHAGEVETSVMLHLAPETVHLELARDHVPQAIRPDLTHLGMRQVCPDGVWGHPSRASAAKGRRWLDQAVEYSVSRIRTLQTAVRHREQDLGRIGNVRG